MDTGEGKFIPFDDIEKATELKKQFPKHGGIFQQGEIIEIKGSKFRVKSINPTTIRLKLLKQ